MTGRTEPHASTMTATDTTADTRPAGTEPSFRVVVDRDSLRPYCVLLQAAYGGSAGAVSRYFDPELWHLAPTDGAVGITATASELQAHNQRLLATQGRV